MHPVCNVIMHAMLVSAVQLANAGVLLWFVWPRKVVVS